MSNTPLWTPNAVSAEQSAMARFMRQAGMPNYQALHAWSVEQPQAFWPQLLDFCDVIYDGETTPALVGATMQDTRFFPRVKLNFAENLLRFRDDHVALVNINESRGRTTLSYHELYVKVAQVAAALKDMGIGAGDRVAGILPNIPEAVIAMLATASLGAVWSSCSPDFGVQGVLDRFGQIAPRVLFAANAYVYNGKKFDCLDKIDQICDGIKEIENVVVVPFVEEHPVVLPSGCSVSLWSSVASGPATSLSVKRRSFNQPLFLMYSSGTTGIPKCIVHGAGGTLLQHAKELVLHTGLTRDSNIAYYTTCGWMMWNWLVSSLFTGCTVTLYDGSPTYPDLHVLWQMIEREGITHFGTSPKFLGACRDKIVPKTAHDLKCLTSVLSTGSPLLPEDFDWVYQNVSDNVQLSSISGGTDIISCFMLGNPLLPVYRGELQAFGLGMNVAAYNHLGQKVVGEKGELVCLSPFVSMPVGFWHDDNGEKYHKAYYSHDDNVWWHGDYIEITQSQGAVGGIVVHGRSDATLNPGGVRIGTAEIYRLVEALPEVDDSIVIGQPHDGDVRVVLFVKLAKGHVLNEQLTERIKKTIRNGATPRHVPALIRQVDKIPYTISGKKVELAVLDIVMGREPKNKDALADKDALNCFRNVLN